MPRNMILTVMVPFLACLAHAAAAETEQDAMAAARTACQPDIAALCPDAAGPRATGQCLRGAADKVSQPCRQALAAVKAARAQ